MTEFSGIISSHSRSLSSWRDNSIPLLVFTFGPVFAPQNNISSTFKCTVFFHSTHIFFFFRLCCHILPMKSDVNHITTHRHTLSISSVKKNHTVVNKSQSYSCQFRACVLSFKMHGNVDCKPQTNIIVSKQQLIAFQSIDADWFTLLSFSLRMIVTLNAFFGNGKVFWRIPTFSKHAEHHHPFERATEQTSKSILNLSPNQKSWWKIFGAHNPTQ